MSHTSGTIAHLCNVKKLDPEFLRSLGLSERADGAIEIPYYDMTGETAYTRLRMPPGRTPRFVSPTGVASIPYGRWRDRGDTGVLFLTEGESDTWAVWSAGLPALGIAGANLAGSLSHEDLIGVGELYLCIDAKGGDVFEAAVLRRLAAIHYAGRVWAVHMPAGVADVSDLYASDPGAFLTRWREMTAAARRVHVPPARPPQPLLPLQRQAGQAVATPPPERRWEFRPMTFAEMKAHVKPPTWLVSRLLVRDQPAVIGGPSKSLKTSIALDLCVSLAAGQPFLGRMAVPTPVKTVMLSGESGDFTIMNIIEKIAESKGEDAMRLHESLTVMTTLPHLSNPLDLAELSRGAKDFGAEVIVIDPLYLSLMAGLGARAEAANMYQMGPLLMGVAESMLSVGVTPILIHHATKPSSRTNEPLQLTDLAFSGIGEFARQWLLVSRREPFDPGASNKLWLSAGGSCGQSGLWALDIDEGELDENFEGKHWRVDIVPASTARQAEKDHLATQAQRRQHDAHERNVDAYLSALDRLAAKSAAGWVGHLEVSDLARQSRDVANRVLMDLADRGIIEHNPAYPGTDARGRPRPFRAVRRHPEDVCDGANV